MEKPLRRWSAEKEVVVNEGTCLHKMNLPQNPSFTANPPEQFSAIQGENTALHGRLPEVHLALRYSADVEHLIAASFDADHLSASLKSTSANVEAGCWLVAAGAKIKGARASRLRHRYGLASKGRPYFWAKALYSASLFKTVLGGRRMISSAWAAVSLR